MEGLSDEIVKGFKRVAALPDDVFRSFTKCTMDIVLKRETEEVLAKFTTLDALHSKQALSTLAGFTVEAGKANAEQLLIRGFLTDHLSVAQVETYIEIYSEEKAALFSLLTDTNFNYPHITGVDWKLSYHIKSHSIERENQPVYFLQFHTESNKPTLLEENAAAKEGGAATAAPAKETVEFACTTWELLDMVKQLRDAAKQFERIQSAK